MSYQITALLRIDAPAKSKSTLKMFEENILGVGFERVEDEDGMPVYQKGFIKIQVLTLVQD